MSNANPFLRLLWPISLIVVPLIVMLGLAWAVWSGRVRIPDAWNPWAPLRIDAPPNLLTRFKLDRAAGDRADCQSALAQADMRLVPVDDRVTTGHSDSVVGGEERSDGFRIEIESQVNAAGG